MTWRASLVTLYPEMFPGPLGISLAGRALEAGAWSLNVVNPRDFATDRHRSVDDTPFGGGPGMVLRPDVLSAAIESVSPAGRTVLMSARGRPITQKLVREFVAAPGLTIVCGRFEGVDQRLVEACGLEEISVGDAVLSGGEIAAMVLLDACVRLLPGVMGHDGSGDEESFENNLLEYPHYTKPSEWRGMTVPDVLTSGDHKAIERWRRFEALRATRERRPDLFAKYVAELSSGVDKASKIE